MLSSSQFGLRNGSHEPALGNPALTTEAFSTDGGSPFSRSTFDKNLAAIGVAFGLGAAAFSTEMKAQLMPDGANLANYQVVAVPYSQNIGYVRVQDPVGQIAASFVCYERVTYDGGNTYYNLAFTAGHVLDRGSAGAGEVLYAIPGLSRTGQQYQPIASWIYPGYVNNGNFTLPDVAILLFPDLGAPSLTLGQVSANEVVTTAGFGRYKTPSTAEQLTPDAASGWSAKVDSLGFGYANQEHYQFTD